MHLGGANPKLARQGKKKHIGIGQVRRVSAGRQRIVEISCEVVEGLSPAVALIATKAERDAQRMRLRPIAVENEYHKRQQRRRGRKPGTLDQKARHLYLGMWAGLQT